VVEYRWIGEEGARKGSALALTTFKTALKEYYNDA